MERLLLSLMILLAACEYPRTLSPGDEVDAGDQPDAPVPDGPTSTIPTPSPLSPLANAYSEPAPAAKPATTFSWDSKITSQATLYHLEISTDPSFVNAKLWTTATSSLSVDLGTAFGTSNSNPIGHKLSWRVKTCIGSACSDYSRPRVFHFGRSVHDFNGDGFSDFAISSFSTNAVDVFFGRTGALNPFRAGSLDGGAGALFGFSLAPAGDVNGDGFADLIVGAPGTILFAIEDCSASIFLGGPGGTFSETADWTVTSPSASWLGYSVSSAGDVNGDGFADVLIGSPNEGSASGRFALYLGGTSLSTTPAQVITGAVQEKLGIKVSSANDFNNDGFGDVIIGTELNRAYIYLGSPTAPYLSHPVLLTSDLGDEGFGNTVAAVGKVDGDDFPDVVVGAPLSDVAGTNAGRVFFYRGTSTLPLYPDRLPQTAILAGPASGALFGTAFAGAGDLNGDGFADIIVGASGTSDNGANSRTGSAHVYFGSRSFNVGLDAKIVGATNDLLGVSVANIGDSDGDGFGDLLVGTQSTSTPQGLAYLYRGASSFNVTADLSFTGVTTGSGFGNAVANLPFPRCVMKKS